MGICFFPRNPLLRNENPGCSGCSGSGFALLAVIIHSAPLNL
jgi:hypothetical protein